MSAGSKIEWTDRTWNPVTGCTKVDGRLVKGDEAGKYAMRAMHDPRDRGFDGWIGVHREGKKHSGRNLDGRTWDEFPK